VIDLSPADALEQAVKAINHRARVFEITPGNKGIIEYLLDDEARRIGVLIL
jgi:hypothetical protein